VVSHRRSHLARSAPHSGTSLKAAPARGRPRHRPHGSENVASRRRSDLRHGARSAERQPIAATPRTAKGTECALARAAGTSGSGAVGGSMYDHVKKLMYTVRVDTPDPRFGNMLLEPFGGVNGELVAAMQYSLQGLNCDDPVLKDLLMDIGT